MFRKALIGAFFAAVAAVPLNAHHSFAAEYESTKQISLRGKLLGMEWANPHSWIHIEVVTAPGRTEIWDVEAGPPNTLYRNGWRKDTIKPGDVIVVIGTKAKAKRLTANARSVQTSDGRTLTAGSSEGNGTAEK